MMRPAPRMAKAALARTAASAMHETAARDAVAPRSAEPCASSPNSARRPRICRFVDRRCSNMRASRLPAARALFGDAVRSRADERSDPLRHPLLALAVRHVPYARQDFDLRRPACQPRDRLRMQRRAVFVVAAVYRERRARHARQDGGERPAGEFRRQPCVDPCIEHPARLLAVIRAQPFERVALLELLCSRASTMPARVRSSTNACADSVISASHAEANSAAQCTAIPPPTLWPNATKRSKPNASRSIGKHRRASSRTKSKPSASVRGSDCPKPRRS
ncbi:hypothetical protein X961_900 [Burkholderia pseudomallei MSHR5613]|nr:hypothetical protein X961_900 [Burkholderia pseudomallei MSHR5613]